MQHGALDRRAVVYRTGVATGLGTHGLGTARHVGHRRAGWWVGGDATRRKCGVRVIQTQAEASTSLSCPERATTSPLPVIKIKKHLTVRWLVVSVDIVVRCEAPTPACCLSACRAGGAAVALGVVRRQPATCFSSSRGRTKISPLGGGGQKAQPPGKPVQEYRLPYARQQ